MREAITIQLKTITEFSNRVYQAFSAPANSDTPYCTYKLTEDEPSLDNKCGSFQGLQVFIYVTPATFSLLDDLVTQVREALDEVMLTTTDSPPRYFTLEYLRTQMDVRDPDNGLFSKRVDFTIPMARP